MAPENWILLLFFTVFSIFLIQIPHSNANPNDHCPPNSELKISNNSILDPPGMNGKLRKQFQLDGPEKCADEFTIVFPPEIEVNSDAMEKGAFLEDFKQFWKFECNDVESTTESLTETEQSTTTPSITTSTPTTVPMRRTVDYIYNVVGKVSPNGTEFIDFSLCEKDKDCWLRINMTEGKVEVITEIDDQEITEAFELENAAIPRNSSFKLTIIVHHYFIEFHMEYGNGNNPGFKIKHWPAFWYNTISVMGFDELQYESMGNWKIVEFKGFIDEILPTPEEMFSVKLPFSANIPQEITAQSTITIRGHIPKNGNKFNIALLRNAPEANEWIGDTVAKLTLDFVSNTIFLVVKIKSKINYSIQESKYHTKKSLGNVNVLKPEIYFEAILVAKGATQFDLQLFSSLGTFSVSFAIEFPLWSITHMNIDGDIELFDEPRFIFNNESKASDAYGLILVPPLDVGDKIDIELLTAAKPENSSFTIRLLAGAKHYNEIIGNTPLSITLDYYRNKFGNGSMSSTKIDNCCKLENKRELEGKIRVFSEYLPEFSIELKEKSFIIDDGSGEVGNYEFAKSGFPPWSVDHIKITGGPFRERDDEVRGKLPKLKRTRAKRGELDLPYMLMLNDSLSVDDTIEIKGKANANFNHFTVHLFHGAQNYEKTVGQTVLEMKIFSRRMELSAFIGTDWHGVTEKKEIRFKLASIGPKHDIKLRISAQSGAYKIAVYLILVSTQENELANFTLPHKLPSWAVLQMIRIGGDLTLTEKPILNTKK